MYILYLKCLINPKYLGFLVFKETACHCANLSIYCSDLLSFNPKSSLSIKADKASNLNPHKIFKN